ncbi:hypothetical protein H4R20_006490, partial [Coemansia guatemalensis]
MASDVNVDVVKVPLRVIGWKGEHLKRLEELVKISHTWVTHAYQFARYILLKEFTSSSGTVRPSTLYDDISVDFFLECLLRLTDAKRLPVNPKRVIARQLALLHRQEYMHIAGLPNLFVIRGAAQFAGFEAEYMYTAYTNCVKLQFGNMLRHVVNVLVHADTDIQALRRRMGNQSEDEIQRAIKAEVRQPINRLKESLQFMRADDRMHSASTIAAREQLQPLFDLYSMLPALPDEGIYYDAVANPIGHLGGYYTLAKILKDNGHHPFQCFPLRTGWIPAHIVVYS